MEGDLKHVSSQSLECPVCLNIFNDPKILSCSHTFCKGCLERLLECTDAAYKLICPVCRAETKVPDEDVNQLQTNLALKSLVEDVKNQGQVCTNCESGDKPHAVVYCQDCGKYLCVACQKMHSQWSGFSGHEVVAIDQITSGKVLLRRRRKCKKHPNESEECFCSECRKYVCFRCGVMDHGSKGHQIVEASVHESDHKKIVDELKSKAEKKQVTIQQYIDFINERKDHMDNVTTQRVDDVTKAYEEAVRQLGERKDTLVGQIERRNEDVKKELDAIKETAEKQISHMTAMTDLVSSGLKIPLEMEALAAHDTLCQELQDILEREDPGHEEPRKTTEVGESFTFQRNVGKDELGLGKMVTWEVKDIQLPTKDSMSGMVATPDGRMAVGCDEVGIEIFSPDGQLQKSVLKDGSIRRLEFLSDGRCVVRNTSSNISLYTSEWEKLDVTFKTLSSDEGGSGGLAVDSDHQIYVGYRKAKKIQVFSPAGGKAIREIPCNGYKPEQITARNDLLIITCIRTMRIIDKEGHVKHMVDKSKIYPYATVTRSNSILIAWVKHGDGLVSIDEYTNDLKQVQTLISDHKIEKPEKRGWYYLQEFQSGEIAFCTPDRLYIFRKQILPNGTKDEGDVVKLDRPDGGISDEEEYDQEYDQGYDQEYYDQEYDQEYYDQEYDQEYYDQEYDQEYDEEYAEEYYEE